MKNPSCFYNLIAKLNAKIVPYYENDRVFKASKCNSDKKLKKCEIMVNEQITSGIIMKSDILYKIVDKIKNYKKLDYLELEYLKKSTKEELYILLLLSNEMIDNLENII